jgi:isocitrate dehydrogenase
MQKITIAKGDGIGPEIMNATLDILKASGVALEYEEITIGEKEYLTGNTSGINQSAWDSIIKNKVFLKAPITTPQGGGYKSLNVSIRKTLGLFANVRPCKSLDPFVTTKHPEMDLVVIRENEEDLYAGIEHQQTRDVVQCLKLITRPGSEKIIRYAFEYAKQQGRKKVTCFAKDNIMKQTDGLFHTVFDEIAKEYPEIENEYYIIDIGTARIATRPEIFDVVVMPNLYGDIVSDITAEITGSVGMIGSSNIGATCAMFEAIHGSAPDIAGKGIANPSALINAAVMMLNHINENEKANLIYNAWLKTIEEGTHTGDIYKEGISTKKVNTKEFSEAVIANIGKKPSELAVSNLVKNDYVITIPEYKRNINIKKELIGVDVFIDYPNIAPNDLAEILHKSETSKLKLTLITNRGVKVYPSGFDETFCTDHWRCRFKSEDGSVLNSAAVIDLLSNIYKHDLDAIKTENLYLFDGKRGFSLGQGE